MQYDHASIKGRAKFAFVTLQTGAQHCESFWLPRRRTHFIWRSRATGRGILWQRRPRDLIPDETILSSRPCEYIDGSRRPNPSIALTPKYILPYPWALFNPGPPARPAGQLPHAPHTRAAMERETRRAHALLFPFPCSGHINPTLKLAELLHARGVHVTFVNTEHNHARLLRSAAGATLRGRDGFRFEAVPDGLVDEDRRAPDRTVRLYLSMRRHCVPPLVALARGVGDREEGAPPVTCVVLSGLVSFALDVAEAIGVPAFVLWGTSACGFVGTLRLRELRQRGYTPLKGNSIRCIAPSHDRTHMAAHACTYIKSCFVRLRSLCNSLTCVAQTRAT